MRINLIAAYAYERVIGQNNKMPWHLPEDYAYFKRTTLSWPVIMGRKTWESIGRALPGRRNIVISSNTSLLLPNAEIFHSLDSAIDQCVNINEVFVIGGSQIYIQAMPLAKRLFITEIDKQFFGDTFFPEVNLEHWSEISRTMCAAKAPNSFNFSFVIYERKTIAL